MALDAMLKRPYSIEPYNPDWVIRFESIRKDIVDSFGDKAVLVEHVGSTAIPGMSAKAVIDVCVLVNHFEDFSKEKELMIEKGYSYEVGYIGPETILFYKEKPDKEKTINIHICLPGTYNAEKFIECTRYLKAHPDRVTMYNELKTKLNAQFPDDYPAYRAGKQDFLKETLELAREEKLEQNQ
jgi:GrpB-like predicted nucleotidyltransferase (UPF0157 family)